MHLQQVMSSPLGMHESEKPDSRRVFWTRGPRWVLTIVLFLALALAACGGPAGTEAPPMDTEVTCEVDGLRVQLERGTAWSWDGEPVTGRAACERFGAALMEYRSIYEGRWGVLSFETAGWVVRVRANTTLENGKANGLTYPASRVVDLVQGAIFAFPHELHHVQLGTGSGDHHGWCIDFEPWEEAVLRLSERDYLRCNGAPSPVASRSLVADVK